LRNDDPDTRPVFFKLAQFQTAKTDLVPLIISYPGDSDIVFNARKWQHTIMSSMQGWGVPHDGGLGYGRSVVVVVDDAVDVHLYRAL
jgi:hypothetical protein